MNTDYNRALQSIEDEKLPKFYLGQQVNSPDGIGIIVDLRMPKNGLYIEPHKARAVVWFSTEKCAAEGTRWVQSEYKLDQISALELEKSH